VPLEAFFKKFRYAVFLSRIAGPAVLVREFKRQIYSKSYFVGMEKDLNKPILDFQSDIQYTLRSGNQNDIDEIAIIAKTAGKESAYELVMRVRFYDSGFRKFYAARTKENEEICYIGWMLSSAEYPELRNGVKGIPPLKENEVILFNLFAFERYRGTGLASSVDSLLCKIAKENGYERVIAYTLINNIAAIKAFEKIGFKKFCWKYDRRLLSSFKTEFVNELSSLPNE